MTTLPGEVAGLPEGGPATLPAVKSWLGRDPEEPDVDDARLTMVIDAVNDQVRTWPVAQKSANVEAPEEAAWRSGTVLGAIMLVVRIDRRRNSPDGVTAFGNDGPVYVQRNDPDIAQFLDLGPNQGLSVG